MTICFWKSILRIKMCKNSNILLKYIFCIEFDFEINQSSIMFTHPECNKLNQATFSSKVTRKKGWTNQIQVYLFPPPSYTDHENYLQHKKTLEFSMGSYFFQCVWCMYFFNLTWYYCKDSRKGSSEFYCYVSFTMQNGAFQSANLLHTPL